MMKSMKKVEVIIESVYLNRLLDLFKSKGIRHYTLIKDVEGNGGHGLRMNDDVTDVGSNSYIFTVCEEETFLSLKEDIRSFVKKYGGKAIVTDAMVILS